MTTRLILFSVVNSHLKYCTVHQKQMNASHTHFALEKSNSSAASNKILLFQHDDREMPRRQMNRARSRSPIWSHDMWEEVMQEDEPVRDFYYEVSNSPKGSEVKYRAFTLRFCGLMYTYTDVPFLPAR